MIRNIALPLAVLVFTAASQANVPHQQNVPASSPEIRYTGRTAADGESVTIAYPGVEIVIEFTGSSLGLKGKILESDDEDRESSSHYNVTLDGEPLPRLDLYSGKFAKAIVAGLNPNELHTLRLVRRSESWIGVTRLDAVLLDYGAKLVAPTNPYERNIISIGDSITCGEKADLFPYVENGPVSWNAENSYAWQIAKNFNAAPHLVSYGGRGLIRDWQGLIEPATGPQLFERALPDEEDAPWDHSQFTPDLVTICLGTNDFSQGIPKRDAFVPTYVRFVKRIHEVHPNAKILLISGPWFGDDDPKKEALNRYILETIELAQDEGQDFVNHHFFDTTYPGTERDAHPIAPQHKAMAKDVSRTITDWLGW